MALEEVLVIGYDFLCLTSLSGEIKETKRLTLTPSSLANLITNLELGGHRHEIPFTSIKSPGLGVLDPPLRLATLLRQHRCDTSGPLGRIDEATKRAFYGRFDESSHRCHNCRNKW